MTAFPSSNLISLSFWLQIVFGLSKVLLEAADGPVISSADSIDFI